MLCQSCKAELKDNAKFCPKCGAKIEPVQVQASATKKCPQCGAENPVSAKFCRKDGYRFESVAPATTDESVKEAIPNDAITQQPSSTQPSTPPRLAIPREAQTQSRKDGTPLRPEMRPVVSSEPKAVADAPKREPKQVRPAEPAPGSKAREGASRAWIIAGIGALVLLTAGASGYLYWNGYFGNRQGTVQDTINAELGGKGLSNVKVEVSKDWIATATGMVSKPGYKDQALSVIKNHKELTDTIDKVQVQPSVADIETNLNKLLADQGLEKISARVNNDLVATLVGVATNEEEEVKAMTLARSVPGVKELKDEIKLAAAAPPIAAEQKPAQETAPQLPPDATRVERSASPPAPTATPVEESVSPPKPAATAVEKSTSRPTPIEDQTAKAPTPKEASASVPAPKSVQDDVAVAPPTQPKTPATDAAPAKLQADINRALKNANIRDVSAQVADDMSVTLNGVAANTAEKDRAFEIATSFSQAKSINDQISLAGHKAEQPKTATEQKGSGQWSIRK